MRQCSPVLVIQPVRQLGTQASNSGTAARLAPPRHKLLHLVVSFTLFVEMGVPQAISGVPGIDISDLQKRKHQISQQLMKAAEGVGFFYVTGL